jgi:hypothetical protein
MGLPPEAMTGPSLTEMRAFFSVACKSGHETGITIVLLDSGAPPLIWIPAVEIVTTTVPESGPKEALSRKVPYGKPESV